MRKLAALIAPLAFIIAGTCRAGDLGIHIVLSGEVAPGVYGQVQLDNASLPPLVYPQPVIILQQAVPLPPVYLHVPPGHARNWRKHCREYNACNRQVYFVRSAEYEPDYDLRSNGYDQEDEHGHDHEHGHGHGHGHEDNHGHGDD